MMFVRLFWVLMATISTVVVAKSAEVVPVQVPNVSMPHPSKREPPLRDPSVLVPGARVTVEGGVRVIRPSTPVSGADALEQADTHGSLIYRGAAFYRVPSAAQHQGGSSDVEKRAAKSSE